MSGHHRWQDIKRRMEAQPRSAAQKPEEELDRWWRLAGEGATLPDLRSLAGKTPDVDEMALCIEAAGEEVTVATLRRYLDALGFDLMLAVQSRETGGDLPLRLGKRET